MQIGYAPDQTFTNSLMMALNLLQENSQADIIANPKVVAQDGRQAEMRVIEEEWFMMHGPADQDGSYSPAQLQKIESGTVLIITPYIGDNNDITLLMAVEVSDSIPKARGSDLPRRDAAYGEELGHRERRRYRRGGRADGEPQQDGRRNAFPDSAVFLCSESCSRTGPMTRRAVRSRSL